MRKRVAMVWISALIAGWLFWVGPVAAVAAPKAYVGLFKDDGHADLLVQVPRAAGDGRNAQGG
jgi:hypothetical protein